MNDISPSFLSIDYVFDKAETACLSGLVPYTFACVYLHAFYICGWYLKAAVGQPRWTFTANIKVLSCLFQVPVISCPHLVTSGERTSLLLCLQAHFLFLLFSLSYWHLLTTPSFLCSSLCREHAKSACSKWAWAGFYDPFWHHGVPRVQGKFWCASLLPTSA